MGTWQADYGGRDVDTLTLRADGMFKQVYENRREDCVYETPWNNWWVERFPDGRVRVHFEGARFYYDGIDIGESQGVEPYNIYYDPYCSAQCDWQDRFPDMVGELILNVRVLRSGELVLAHMWPWPNHVFAETQVFHRIAASSESETRVR